MKIFIFLFLSFSFLSCKSSSHWRTASRATAEIAPIPSKYKKAVVQIYTARLWGFRGLVADHTWISTKQEGAKSYKVYEVIGWLRRLTKSNTVLRIAEDLPDRLWYGNKPKLLVDLRDISAKQVIDKIHQVAISYPYKTTYSIFGPNSNTFTSWMACKVPELNLNLSIRAIGKNFFKDCKKKIAINHKKFPH